ncbi:hypothetical protein ACHAXR_010942 [Thalassiosira sp. AJA248-18]
MDIERSRRHHGRDRRERCRSRSSSRGDNDQDRSRRSKGGRRRHSARDHSSKKHKRDEDHKNDSSSESSTFSSSSSVSSRGARRKHHSKKRHHKDRKKKHKKKKERKHKSKKKSHRRSRSGSPSISPSAAIPTAPPGAHELASALTQLFQSYPAMTSLDEGGIPLLFIQLSRGTEYNLAQMPDRNLARLLEFVFEALKVHGMELGSNGAWKWGNAVPTGGRQGGDDLALLRLARALLSGVGFTMERVDHFEKGEIKKLKQLQEQERQLQTQHMNDEAQMKETASINAEKAEKNEKDIRHKKRVERMTAQMLDRFDPKNSSSSESSLANELQGICDVLMEGESVQLDGIENGKLKATLGQLFQLIGLERVEMEDDEDDEEGEEEAGGDANVNNEEKIMGYALPGIDDIRATVASNLHEVLRVCRFRSSGGSEGAPTAWAANQAITKSNEKIAQEESSSDDDDGPAPLGTMAAVKALKRKRSLPQVQNSATSGGIDEGGREEWMMVPGEHDFLKGIQSKSAHRSRTFKNEKNRGQSIPASAQRNNAQPINPEVLEEVNAIQKAYEESRGPSLLDAHQQMQHETKQQQQGQKKDWKWSRDKDLDDGRRVDKNALHLVLGGASTELKSKFQGSLGP